MDMFQKIRANRIAALALARQRRESEFSPFRCTGISDAHYRPVSPDRGELMLTLSDGRKVVLPHFYLNHAQRLQGLPEQERVGYLKDVWLNYNAWRLRDG